MALFIIIFDLFNLCVYPVWKCSHGITNKKSSKTKDNVLKYLKKKVK